MTLLRNFDCMWDAFCIMRFIMCFTRTNQSTFSAIFGSINHKNYAERVLYRVQQCQKRFLLTFLHQGSWQFNESRNRTKMVVTDKTSSVYKLIINKHLDSRLSYESIKRMRRFATSWIMTMSWVTDSSINFSRIGSWRLLIHIIFNHYWKSMNLSTYRG